VRTGTFSVSGSDNYKLIHEAAGDQKHSLLLTGSLKLRGTSDLTGDLTVTGNGRLTGDLTVVGNLTANSYNVVNTTVTEIAAQGSTNFGNGYNDVHRVTGTLAIKGKDTQQPVLSVTGSQTAADNRVGILTNLPPTTLSVSGTVSYAYHKVTGTSANLANVLCVFVGCSNNAAVSITMPPPLNKPGQILIIKDEASTQPRTGTTKITLTASSGTTIDGQAHYYILGSRAAISLYSNGASEWFVF